MRQVDEMNFDPGHPSIAISQSNLAMVLKDLGKPEAAEPLLREAHRSFLTCFGPEHPSTRIAKNNLDGLRR